MVDQINRIILEAVDKTAPAYATAKQSASSFAETTTTSAKQTAAAMRMIPAQMTDIVVSLQAGQAPLTVLLQQGGQLKDMFGGVVPAAKAMGNYLLAMVSPLTLVAAGVATLALAYHQGAEESREFNRQIALTNGYAGLSTSQLMTMAAAMGQVSGTQSQAAAALAELVGTGKIAGDQMDLIASAAIAMSKATGAALKDVVKEFVELGDEPVEASIKLNEQHHYLTQAVYEQIKALDEQGLKTEAAALAQATYANAIKTSAAQVNENLGWIERSFKSVMSVAKSAWDTIVGLGRDKTGAEQLAGLKQQLSIREAQRPLNAMTADAHEKGNAALRQQITLMERVHKQVDEQAKKRGEDAKIQQAGIEAAEAVGKRNDSAKGLSAVNRELKEYQKQIADIRRANPNSDLLDPKLIAATEADIRKKAMGGAGPKPREDGIDARLAKLKAQAEQEERQFKQSLETIKADYDVGLLTTRQYLDRQFELKNNALQGELDIARKQEEIARGKRNVAAVERYSGDVKRITDEMTANWAKHATDTMVLSAKVQRAVEEYRASLNASLGTRQQGIDDELQGAGMGAKALEELRRLTEVRREADKQREQLRRDRDKGEANGGISQAQYDAQLAIVSDHYAKRIAQEQDFNAKSSALQGDWTVGAKKALADYSESAADVAGQSQRAFSGLYSGLEDAAVAWATGSKVSIKDVGRTFAAELIRMEIRAKASSLYKAAAGGGGWASLLGGFTGGLSGGTAASIANVAGGSDSLGTMLGLMGFAKGAVFNSPSLSAYSNGVYDRPTPFMFAKGAGIFGEAGPEAILPLRRGSDGNLGVLANAGGGAQPSGPAKITLVHQSMRPMQVAEQRVMSDGEIVLMIKEQAAAARNGAVEDVAGGFSDSSHIVSQGFDGSYRAPRTR